jgi:hypothetical protein
VRGRRAPTPPFGWDEQHPPPRLGWRRSKEIIGGDHEGEFVAVARGAPPAAFAFLPSVARQWPRAPAPMLEPTPPPKTRQRPRERQRTDVTAAARQRLRRERQANGQIPVIVTIDEVGWEVALTEAGFLTVSDPAKAAIGRALSHMLEVLLRHSVTP